MIHNDITQILLAYEAGEKNALDQLYPAVYQELRQIAQRQISRSWAVETICTTALINESYLKLVGGNQTQFEGRSHFYAVAAKAMRQIILNYAEQKRSLKRGGNWQRVTIDQTLGADQHNAELLTRVSDAIDAVAKVDEELADVVEMRFFAGMSETEIALVTGVSDRTVRRRWQKAKALLVQALSD